jgi:DNA processing protein
MTDHNPPDLAHWVALCLIPGLGSKTIARLLDQFGSTAAILAADADALQAVPRIGPRLAAAIRAIDLDRVRAELVTWQADGIAVLHQSSAAYPPALAELDDAPPVLFRLGQPGTPHEQRAAAIVGTRRPSAPARHLAGTLAAALADHGWTVVSGLASGIDTAAHRGAIRANGRTLAVLGSGVRMVYPSQNAGLAQRILAHGALIAEVHPDAPPNSPMLVARNRLISGLSRAVIVIEAGETSGSLHAARFAQVQGRIVYAVDNESAGNRTLIAGGARPLPPDTTAWDQLVGELIDRY